jgi:hypothetical protein
MSARKTWALTLNFFPRIMDSLVESNSGMLAVIARENSFHPTTSPKSYGLTRTISLIFYWESSGFPRQSLLFS